MRQAHELERLGRSDVASLERSFAEVEERRGGPARIAPPPTEEQPFLEETAGSLGVTLMLSDQAEVVDGCGDPGLWRRPGRTRPRWSPAPSRPRKRRGGGKAPAPRG